MLYYREFHQNKCECVWLIIAGTWTCGERSCPCCWCSCPCWSISICIFWCPCCDCPGHPADAFKYPTFENICCCVTSFCPVWSKLIICGCQGFLWFIAIWIWSADVPRCVCGITCADDRRPLLLSWILNNSSNDASLPANDPREVMAPGKLLRFCLESSVARLCEAGGEPRISGFIEEVLLGWLVLPCVSQSCCHLRIPATVVKGKFSQYSIPVFLFRIGGLLLWSGESLPDSGLSWLASMEVADCKFSAETYGRSWRSNDSASWSLFSRPSM